MPFRQSLHRTELEHPQTRPHPRALRCAPPTADELVDGLSDVTASSISRRTLITSSMLLLLQAPRDCCCRWNSSRAVVLRRESASQSDSPERPRRMHLGRSAEGKLNEI